MRLEPLASASTECASRVLRATHSAGSRSRWVTFPLGVGRDGGWVGGGGRAGAGGRKGWGWEEKAANTHTASVAFARHRAGAVAEQSPSRSPA